MENASDKNKFEPRKFQTFNNTYKSDNISSVHLKTAEPLGISEKCLAAGPVPVFNTGGKDPEADVSITACKSHHIPEFITAMNHVAV